MKDYRVTVKVRNNRILNAIENIGGRPGSIWCEQAGLNYSHLNAYINMLTSPIEKGGGLKESALLLCDVLGVMPDDLWSEEQLYPLEKNFSELEMDFEQVAALMGGEPRLLEEQADDDRVGRLIDDALKSLTQREKKVVIMRFRDDVTQKDTGAALGITSSRVQQIEKRALRKLRHPKCAKGLSACMDLSEFDEEFYRKYQPPATN